MAAAVGTLQGVVTWERVCKPSVQGAVLYRSAKRGGAALAGWHLAWKSTQTWPRKTLPSSSWGLGSHVYPQEPRMSFGFMILQGSSWLHTAQDHGWTVPVWLPVQVRAKIAEL